MFRLAGLLEGRGAHVDYFAMHDPRNLPCDTDRYFVSEVDFEDPPKGVRGRAQRRRPDGLLAGGKAQDGRAAVASPGRPGARAQHLPPAVALAAGSAAQARHPGGDDRPRLQARLPRVQPALERPDLRALRRPRLLARRAAALQPRIAVRQHAGGRRDMAAPPAAALPRRHRPVHHALGVRPRPDGDQRLSVRPHRGDPQLRRGRGLRAVVPARGSLPVRGPAVARKGRRGARAGGDRDRCARQAGRRRADAPAPGGHDRALRRGRRAARLPQRPRAGRRRAGLRGRGDAVHLPRQLPTGRDRGDGLGQAGDRQPCRRHPRAGPRRPRGRARAARRRARPGRGDAGHAERSGSDRSGWAGPDASV